MKKKVKHAYKWAVIYGILLVAYSVIALLDAFLVPTEVIGMDGVKKYENPLTSQGDASAEGEVETGLGTDGLTGNSDPVITENSYSCENFTITISKERFYDSNVYIADIVVKDSSYLKAGLADGKFGRNVKAKTSVIAEECEAILAVNGDYYGFREEGFVMRNGYLYRTDDRDENSEKTRDALVVYYDGTFEIVDEKESDAEELAENGAYHIFSFGPGLVEDGECLDLGNDMEEHAYVDNPRTAIGIIEPLHYLLVVCDGRTDESEGMTLEELADVMCKKGCEIAYNLDGGGSSTMYFMGEIVNCPTTDGKEVHERRVSDIVYIGE